MAKFSNLIKSCFTVGAIGLASLLGNINTASAKDYTTLDFPPTAQKTVVMVFSFLCVHCNAVTNEYHVPQFLDEYFNKQKNGVFEEMHFISKDSQDYITPFVKLASILNLTHRTDLIPGAYALAYKYKDDNNVLKEYVEKNYKLSEKDVNKLWNSFAVNTLVKKQLTYSTKYNVQATPTFIINGKYELNLNNIGTELNEYIASVNANGGRVTADDLGHFLANKIISIANDTYELDHKNEVPITQPKK